MDGKRIRMFLPAVAATLILLGANMAVQSRMDSIIREKQLFDQEFLEGAPPIVAFTTVALGGFRGIIADMLWFRSISLQEEGKYFELVQLASWITKLQPKFTGAAAYLGWNMAYNVSVTYSSPVDRWRWISRGIDIFHEALRYNPNDPELYKELGWIYQHKLGNVMDDAQRYYKYEIARTMLKVYGAHYPDWTAFAAAPENDRAFDAAYPAGSPLRTALQSAGVMSMEKLYEDFKAAGVLPENVRGALTSGDQKALDAFLRAKWLKREFVMDPSAVLRINKKYGELDWLIPESFAIYWAFQGKEHSRKNDDLVSCERMIVQSVQVSFSSGRMLLPGKQASMNFILIPNLALLRAVQDTYETTMKENPGVASFRGAYENFLTDAVVVMYSYGQYSESRRLFRKLRQEYGKGRNMDFDRFVVAEWTEDLRDGGYKQNQDLISSLIFRSCILLGYGDRDAAEAHLKIAQMAYDSFKKKYSDVERLSLAPFDLMKKQIVLSCIQNFPFIAERLKAEIHEDAAVNPVPAPSPEKRP